MTLIMLSIVGKPIYCQIFNHYKTVKKAINNALSKKMRSHYVD